MNKVLGEIEYKFNVIKKIFFKFFIFMGFLYGIRVFIIDVVL